MKRRPVLQLSLSPCRNLLPRIRPRPKSFLKSIVIDEVDFSSWIPSDGTGQLTLNDPHYSEIAGLAREKIGARCRIERHDIVALVNPLTTFVFEGCIGRIDLCQVVFDEVFISLSLVVLTGYEL